MEPVVDAPVQVLAQQDVDEFELDVIGALLRPAVATLLFQYYIECMMTQWHRLGRAASSLAVSAFVVCLHMY
jgi:hypothetical protein